MFNRLFHRLRNSKLNAELRQTFSSLQNRNYRVYAIGQFVSMCGTFMQQVALSWIAYRLTGSPAALGIVSFAGALPLLLFTYFGGMVADRFDQRKVLIVTTSLAMTQAVVLTILSINDWLSVPWLVVLSVFVGCVSAIEVPTRQAFVASLVKEAELVNAIGLNSAFFNTSRMLGPMLAGLVLGMFGENICFIANALSYVAALATLGVLTVESNLERQSKDGGKARGPAPVLKTLLQDARIRSVMLLTFITALFGFQHAVLLPVITKDILGGDATVLAFLSAASAIGGLIGSLSLARVKNRLSLGNLMGFGVVGLALSLVGLGFSTVFFLSILASAFAGVFMAVQFSGGNSMLQTSVDPSVRGRVMALYSWAMVGSAPLAALMSGWLAETVGVPFTLTINAACLVLGAAIYLIRRPSESSAGTN